MGDIITRDPEEFKQQCQDIATGVIIALALGLIFFILSWVM
jgi:hypothetical protein